MIQSVRSSRVALLAAGLPLFSRILATTHPPTTLGPSLHLLPFVAEPTMLPLLCCPWGMAHLQWDNEGAEGSCRCLQGFKVLPEGPTLGSAPGPALWWGGGVCQVMKGPWKGCQHICYLLVKRGHLEASGELRCWEEVPAGPAAHSPLPHRHRLLTEKAKAGRPKLGKPQCLLPSLPQSTALATPNPLQSWPQGLCACRPFASFSPFHSL